MAYKRDVSRNCRSQRAQQDRKEQLATRCKPKDRKKKKREKTETRYPNKQEVTLETSEPLFAFGAVTASHSALQPNVTVSYTSQPKTRKATR